MKFPTLPGGRRYRVNVPKMDGGVNLHDGETQVGDNQLTACRNMWWKDGMLRTRPGVSFGVNDVKPDEVMNKEYTCRSYDAGISKKQLLIEKNTAGENGNEHTFTVCTLKECEDGITDKCSFNINTAHGAKGSVMLVPSGNYKNEADEVYSSMLFTAIQDGSSKNWKYEINAQKGSSSGWEDVTEEAYIPTVLVNGKPVTDRDEPSVNGTLFEGYNLLTNKFRTYFTTGEGGLYYFLPKKNLTGPIMASLTLSNGKTHKATLSGSQTQFNIPSSYTFTVDREAGYAYFSNTSAPKTPVALSSAGVRNNVMIQAGHSEGSSDIIFKMTFNTWFGGDRSGYKGGTRLFVGGNPEHPNLIHWSDVNNPLYFPENNYAYIGSAGSPVTAFAKQGEKLIVFKENEIYYAEYVVGDSYTAEDVMEGRVVDVAAVSAKFPITPVHPSIGCNCPDTIQLCNNRLVWMTQDRRVYVMTSANQFSETNVSELSVNIQKRLSAYSAEQLAQAKAYDYDSNYLLMVGNEVFTFDYNDSKFTYYSQGGSNDSAAQYVPWYIWRVKQDYVKVECAVMFPGATYLVMVGADPDIGEYERQEVYRIYAKLEGKEDSMIHFTPSGFKIDSEPVSCMFRTKIFDFERPEQYKDIEQVYLGVSSESDYDIDVSWLTDRGETAANPLRPVMSETGLRVRRLCPNMRRALRFGLCAESQGAFGVDSLVLKFMVPGGSTRG